MPSTPRTQHKPVSPPPPNAAPRRHTAPPGGPQAPPPQVAYTPSHRPRGAWEAPPSRGCGAPPARQARAVPRRGRGAGRENLRRRARGKAGGGAARRAGRAWERPPPPPAFERATQGARPRFKSKRPPARQPSRAGGAKGGRRGGAGHPRRPGPWGRKAGRQPVERGGRLMKLGRGPHGAGPRGGPGCPPSRRQVEPGPQTAGGRPCTQVLQPWVCHPLMTGLHKRPGGQFLPPCSQPRERGSPKNSSKGWWCHPRAGLEAWRPSWKKCNLNWGLVEKVDAQVLQKLRCGAGPGEVREGWCGQRAGRSGGLGVRLSTGAGVLLLPAPSQGQSQAMQERPTLPLPPAPHSPFAKMGGGSHSPCLSPTPPLLGGTPTVHPPQPTPPAPRRRAGLLLLRPLPAPGWPGIHPGSILPRSTPHQPHCTPVDTLSPLGDLRSLHLYQLFNSGLSAELQPQWAYSGWWVGAEQGCLGGGGKGMPPTPQLVLLCATGEGSGLVGVEVTHLSHCLPSHRVPHYTGQLSKDHHAVRTRTEQALSGRPYSVTLRTLPRPSPRPPSLSCLLHPGLSGQWVLQKSGLFS